MKFKCLIRLNGKPRIRWDFFVFIMSIWNCYSLPFNIAFSDTILDQWYFEALNSITDICFGIDILFNFRTTFLNRQTGDEIANSKQIAINYVSGKFWIDFFATIPFDQILGQIIEGRIAKKF